MCDGDPAQPAPLALRPLGHYRGDVHHADTPGSNHFPFTARHIARKLVPGHYRLQATPHAHGLVGHTLTAEPDITAPKHNTTTRKKGL
jgi:hypothetical protein